MHLEDWLCRYQAQAVNPEERQRIEEHLHACDECRLMADNFRRIDAFLREAPNPPADWERVEKNVRRSMRWTVGMLWALGIGAAVQAPLGLILILIYGERYPIEAGFGGACLISDSVLFLALLFWGWGEYLRVQDATRSWQRMRDEWIRHLEEGLKWHRRLMILSWITLAMGLLMIYSANQITSRVADGIIIACSIFGLWIHPRRARLWRSELTALRSFESF